MPGLPLLSTLSAAAKALISGAGGTVVVGITSVAVGSGVGEFTVVISVEAKVVLSVGTGVTESMEL
jgi:hypothetical protein